MWWYPKAVTVHGHDIDRLLMFIFWLTLAVFVVTQGVYIYFIVKYRYRKGVKAVYSHGNNRLELVWTAIPAVVFVTLAIFSNREWLKLRDQKNIPADEVKVDIVAYQFGFHIRNQGADDKLGAYNLERLTTRFHQGTNNFGQDMDDPAGFDDFQTENQFTIPVNRSTNVILRSQDVIHAFYIPEFRVYQDMVPGHTISWIRFIPEQTGHYAIACNQLCGAGHYNMQAKIDVVSKEDYAKFLAKGSEEALKKRAAAIAEPKTAAVDQSPAVRVAETSVTH